MTKSLGLIAGALLVAACLASDKLSAEQMIAEIKKVDFPLFDPATKPDDKASMAAYEKNYADASAQRAKLILNYAEAYPNDKAVPDWLQVRWRDLAGIGRPIPADRYKAVLADIELITKKNRAPRVVLAGDLTKANFAIDQKPDDEANALKVAEEFARNHPKAPEGIQLYMQAADGASANARIEVYRKAVAAYPSSPFTGMFKGAIHQAESVGQPFEFSFTDAISGKKVDADSLKGKVVLIDFWATWCGPCVSAMPELKAAYEKYRAQGFEVVGVSLDQAEKDGGLDKLKDFVTKNGLTWPQYYQGAGWDGEFSTRWGIMSIPTAFLIDRKGILRDVNAGTDLARKIEEFLARDRP